VDKNALPLLKQALEEEVRIRSDKRLGNPGSFDKGEWFGNRHHLSCWNCDILGVTAPCEERTNAVTRTPQLDTLTHSLHHSSYLQSDDSRHPGRWRISAGSLQ
jgi:hypothetical protein